MGQHKIMVRDSDKLIHEAEFATNDIDAFIRAVNYMTIPASLTIDVVEIAGEKPVKLNLPEPDTVISLN